ncbi:MAG TPA: hypothetical protein VFO67_11420 [Gemmatimonadales bacterium]|nr:hypothetical protein [Gemmatimonadales bacterium]
MRTSLISLIFVGFVVLGPAQERVALQSTASAQSRLTSRIVVTVPADDAELSVNGENVTSTPRLGTAPSEAT